MTKNKNEIDSRAQSFMEQFNKKMKGRAQLKKASEYHLPFMTKRMPTGLLTLDTELKGGFPCGGISQIVGPKNAGKSYLTWQVIRQQQFYRGQDLRVLLAMTEMRADRSQARLAGVKIAFGEEDIDLEQKARKEGGLPALSKAEVTELQTEVGTIHELHGMSGEDIYDGILGAVEGNIYHLIVIDSIGSVMSAAESEAESVGDRQYGGASGPTTQFCKKLSAMLTMDDSDGHTRDSCIVAINQVRDNIGDPHKEWRSPGGRALEHAKFVDLFVTSGASVGTEEPIMTSQGTKKRFIQTGKEINWRIEKGKAGIHEGGKGSYIYDFRSNAADFFLDTFVAGVRGGVIEAAGAWIGIPDPNATGKYVLRSQGKEAFLRALQEDAVRATVEGRTDSLVNRIRSDLFKKNGININYEW